MFFRLKSKPFSYSLLAPAVIAQIFNTTEELKILIETLTNEANAEIETELMTAEMKTRK